MATRGTVLSPLIQTLIERRALAGQSLRAIARDLGLSFNTVRKYAPKKQRSQFEARAA